MRGLTYFVFIFLLLAVVQLIGAQSPIQEKASLETHEEGENSPVLRQLIRDADNLVETMRTFLSTLSRFDKVRNQEGEREAEIRSYGVKRNNNNAFQISGWRKKRSTVESDFITAMFTGKLDRMAKDTLLAVYQFVDDLEKARQYYEGPNHSIQYKHDVALRTREGV